MAGEVNGQSWHRDFEERQERKFSSLESILESGFEKIAHELQLLREQGHIPVGVADKMMTMLIPIIRTLCVTLIVLIAWFTGVKYAIPHIFQ